MLKSETINMRFKYMSYDYFEIYAFASVSFPWAMNHLLECEKNLPGDLVVGSVLHTGHGISIS